MDLDLEQIKSALQLFKESIGLVKAVKDALPESPKKEAASKSLIAAETAAQLAEVSIAKALEYPLCKCTFPPGIIRMLSCGGYQDRYKCPKCDTEYLVKDKHAGKMIITGVPKSAE